MAERIGGKLVTFYSFKGGVGRTMSLANVAFLAANQGKRVLVMDWDLEAPGLAYYFRGLIGPEKTDPIRKAPGVLNILWDWYRSVEAVTGHPDLDELLMRYTQGGPFDDCTQAILGAETFVGTGELHYMSAGSAALDIPSTTPYSEALSLFPWPQFFTDSVGGALIDAWRNWAKRNFDLILIDSRTGLADVAGVCTMLFPDEVYLCFVLNRQNIEGTARVAASIRAHRKNEVMLRAAPMRIARQGTSEENDAQANALKFLTRTGKFTDADVARDFAQLSIASSQSVPFYETIAPFAVSDSEFDPLTLNYCQMASAILGERVAPPVITDTFRQQVRRRQAPRSATVDYVSKLLTAEPVRAIQELTNLVDSAQMALHDDGDIPSFAYVNAIVDTTFQLNVDELEAEFATLMDSILQLLRLLYGRDQVMWRRPLVQVIERILGHVRFDLNDAQSELLLLEELDHLLSEFDDPDVILERIAYRRRAAQIMDVLSSEDERVLQAADESFSLLELFEDLKRGEMTEDDRETVAIARIDLHLLMGDALVNGKQTSAAYEHYLAGLGLAAEDHRNRRGDVRRLTAAIHTRIASRFDETLISPVTAARHAVLALDTNVAIAASGARLIQLCGIMLHPEVSAETARDFLERIYGPSPERTGPSRSIFIPGLTSLRPAAMSELFVSLAEVVAKASLAGVSKVVLSEIGQAGSRMILSSRARFMVGARNVADLVGAARVLRNELAMRGIDTREFSAELQELTVRSEESDTRGADAAE